MVGRKLTILSDKSILWLYTFEDIPDAFQVTITGPNYIPYRYKSGYATGMDNSLNQYVRIYPNPVSDILMMDIDFPEGHMEMYDIHGRLITEQEILLGSNEVNMSAYPDGTYILKFRSTQGTGWFKVLKQP